MVFESCLICFVDQTSRNSIVMTHQLDRQLKTRLNTFKKKYAKSKIRQALDFSDGTNNTIYKYNCTSIVKQKGNVPGQRGSSFWKEDHI